MIGARPTLNRQDDAARGSGPRKKRAGFLAVLRVGALPGQRARGRLIAGAAVIRCALGPAGIVRRKREGDGATPAGRFRLERTMIRADRLPRPPTALPLRPLRREDGWCDDAGSTLYNRPIRRPFASGHEALWREDALYDCLVVLDYNIAPVQRRRGSAIFFHVAAPKLAPTAGCVAIPRAAMLRLLPRLGRFTCMLIG